MAALRWARTVGGWRLRADNAQDLDAVVSIYSLESYEGGYVLRARGAQSVFLPNRDFATASVAALDAIRPTLVAWVDKLNRIIKAIDDGRGEGILAAVYSIIERDRNGQGART